MIRGFHPGKNSSVGHDVQSVNIIASHRRGPRCCRSKMDAEVTLYVDESRHTAALVRLFCANPAVPQTTKMGCNDKWPSSSSCRGAPKTKLVNVCQSNLPCMPVNSKQHHRDEFEILTLYNFCLPEAYYISYHYS